jgi:hypothetical protein
MRFGWVFTAVEPMACSTVTGKPEPALEAGVPEASDVPPPQALRPRAATAARAGTILRNTMLLLETVLGKEPVLATGGLRR